MKKKFFSLVFAFAFILTGAVCLTACGGGGGVNLHNKTYAISNTGSYVFYETVDGNDTVCANPIQYLTENWDAIVAADQTFGASTAEELLEKLKAFCVDDEITKALKGAVITIGKEVAESESVHKSDFVCKMNDQVIFQTQIKTDTFNKNRTQASFYNNEDPAAGDFHFELTDFDSKDGTIKDIEVRFRLTNGQSNTYYTNHMKFGIVLAGGKEFIASFEYKLESVSNNN